MNEQNGPFVVLTSGSSTPCRRWEDGPIQAEFTFCPKWSVVFRITGSQPNLLHRFLQRWLLGIRWRKVMR